MNLVTAVIVNSAMEQAEQDRIDEQFDVISTKVRCSCKPCGLWPTLFAEPSTIILNVVIHPFFSLSCFCF